MYYKKINNGCEIIILEYTFTNMGNEAKKIRD